MSQIVMQPVPASQIPVEILSSLNESQLQALAAVDRRQQEAGQAEIEAEEILTPREFAAREIEAVVDSLGDDANCIVAANNLLDVARALRGDMEPAEGAKVLIDSLWNRLIPSEFKSKSDGVIRVAINDANRARDREVRERNEALNSAPADALWLFRDFQEAILYLRLDEAGDIARQFFTPKVPGVPPLAKALEALIIADDGNEISRLLVNDKQLAEEVELAVSRGEKRAKALINSMQNRARTAVRIAKEAFQRRRNGGIGAHSQTGKTARERAKVKGAKPERVGPPKGKKLSAPKHGRKKSRQEAYENP